MTTYVCPSCTYRWKVIPDGIDRDSAEVCSNCACPHCSQGTWVDSNSIHRRCHFCRGTGRKPKEQAA